MTPEQRKAVERLIEKHWRICDDRCSMTLGAGICDCGAGHFNAGLGVMASEVLALVREPVASVEGRVMLITEGVVDVDFIDYGMAYGMPAWEGVTHDQPLRIDVHAVDAGEEK